MQALTTNGWGYNKRRRNSVEITAFYHRKVLDHDLDTIADGFLKFAKK